MAYFYKHIKGLTSAETKWKIDCEQLDIIEREEEPTGELQPSKNPLLKYKKSTDSEVQDLGNILTSNMINGVINNNFTFRKHIIFYDYNVNEQDLKWRGEIKPDSSDATSSNKGIEIWGGLRDYQGERSKIVLNKKQLKLQGTPDTNVRIYTEKMYLPNKDPNKLVDLPVTISIEKVTKSESSKTTQDWGIGITYQDYNRTNCTLVNPGAISTDFPPNADPTIWFNSRLISTSFIHTNGIIKSNNYIEGLYFNTTSDERAKKDVVKADFSALNIINKLPIYNFTYKNDNIKSIGIIAQEALGLSAGDFSLVSNEKASGENNDYMTVKESKLVYVAWKAIQEQQEIIDNQQKQIDQLKELVIQLLMK